MTITVTHLDGSTSWQHGVVSVEAEGSNLICVLHGGIRVAFAAVLRWRGDA